MRVTALQWTCVRPVGQLLFRLTCTAEVQALEQDLRDAVLDWVVTPDARVQLPQPLVRPALEYLLSSDEYIYLGNLYAAGPSIDVIAEQRRSHSHRIGRHT